MGSSKVGGGRLHKMGGYSGEYGMSSSTYMNISWTKPPERTSGRSVGRMTISCRVFLGKSSPTADRHFNKHKRMSTEPNTVQVSHDG